MLLVVFFLLGRNQAVVRGGCRRRSGRKRRGVRLVPSPRARRWGRHRFRGAARPSSKWMLAAPSALIVAEGGANVLENRHGCGRSRGASVLCCSRDGGECHPSERRPRWRHEHTVDCRCDFTILLQSRCPDRGSAFVESEGRTDGQRRKLRRLNTSLRPSGPDTEVTLRGGSNWRTTIDREGGRPNRWWRQRG